MSDSRRTTLPHRGGPSLLKNDVVDGIVKRQTDAAKDASTVAKLVESAREMIASDQMSPGLRRLFREKMIGDAMKMWGKAFAQFNKSYSHNSHLTSSAPRPAASSLKKEM